MNASFSGLRRPPPPPRPPHQVLLTGVLSCVAFLLVFCLWASRGTSSLSEVEISELEVRSSKVEVRSSEFEVRSSKFEARNSKFGVRSSKFDVRSSEFELRASNSKLRTSNFELSTSSFAIAFCNAVLFTKRERERNQVRSSEFEVRSSKFGARSSKFKRRSSKFGIQSSEIAAQSSQFEFESAKLKVDPQLACHRYYAHRTRDPVNDQLLFFNCYNCRFAATGRRRPANSNSNRLGAICVSVESFSAWRLKPRNIPEGPN